MRLYPLLLTGLILLPAQAIAQTIMIGTAAQYDKGIFTVDAASLQGFDKALGDVLCQRAGLSCEWKVMPREDLLPALKSSEVDVVMAAIPANSVLDDGIEKTVAYLQPDPFITVGLSGTELHKHVKHMGSVSDPAFDEWFPTTGYTNVVFPTLEDALKAIESGEADAVIGEQADLAPLVKASNGKFVVIGHNDSFRPGVTMALRSEDTDLRFSLEDHIYNMMQDGSLNVLTEEWFGLDAAEW